jgi:Ca2+-binding RTX toxin-like protein
MISGIKLAVPIGIILLCNALLPLTANALPLINGGGNGMFLPVPHQLFPTTPANATSYSMSSSTSSPNSFQGIPGSDLNVHNTSDRYYYNNTGSWVNKTPYDSWNRLFAVAPFLNVPKNLIVPETCLLLVCPPIIGTQRGDIIIATAVNNARIVGLGGNDVIECGQGNCKVFTAFGNNVLMSGPSISAHLFAGSGGYPRPGNNIFIGGGGETLMVGGRGNDQFYAGNNNLFDGGGDIMIGGSGANYFDCGPNGNGVILDFNPAKGDTKSSNCKFVIPSYSANEFGPGLPNMFGEPGSLGGHIQNHFGGPGSLPAQILSGFSANQANSTNTGNGTGAVMAHTPVLSPH